jgi:hypothetical protein
MNKGNKTKYGKSKQHQTKEPNTALEDIWYVAQLTG